MSKKITCILFISVLIACLTAIGALAQTQNLCQTWEIFEQDQLSKYGEMYHDCYNGVCDNPSTRDANIPGANDPIKYIRLYFNIFCEDNGSNCATTAATLSDQVAALNTVYLPMRIQFEYDYRFVNSSTYRYGINYYNAHDMKAAYAVNPDQQMNIYITGVSGGSFGTFPWDDVRLPLSVDGGVVLTEGHVYPTPYYDNVLAHEIGHTIGLWHTHHGVSEVTQCGDCYERADGLNADVTGDLCSETPPTPVNYYCQDPGGTDYCSSVAWGTTDYHNFMSYSPIYGGNCWTHFDPQQWGRIHCWVDNVLSSWLISVAPEVTITIPGSNAIYVPGNSIVAAIFNTDMNGSTINSSTFKVIGKTTGQYDGIVTYAPASLYAVFTHTEDFREGEEITVVLTDDIQSSGGLPLENGYTWSFTVKNCGTAAFGSGVNYATGARPFDITLADFDDDGSLDAATCSKSYDNISILPNSGTGTFPLHTDAPVGPYDKNPQRIHSADFDNDGDMDLVTANSGNATITTYINNGLGGFPTANWITSTLPYNPYDCYPADMDLDGDMDIVYACALNDKVGIMYNTGSGAFSSYTTQFSLPSGYNPIGACAADLNNDGAMDIISANYGGDNIAVILSDGSGLYAAPVYYTVGNAPMDIAAADFNGDGYMDLAVCNYFDNVSVLINQQDGTFGAQTVYIASNSPTAIVAANFDQDSDIDFAIITEGNDQVLVFANNGSGSFGTPTPYSVGDNPRGIFAGDLDNDGSADLITANQYGDNITVIKNKSVPTAPGLISPANDARFLLNATILLDCQDVIGAAYYRFEIDDDPYFGSPQVSGLIGVPESQWVVSPALPVGDYYWRVKACNNCGYGPYSAVRTLEVYTTGGGGSCPILFSYNGTDFVEENPLLTGCEKSGYVDVVTDFYHINNEVVPVNGKAVFQLKELENEITYLDNFELITVDHSAATGVGCSVDGQIFTYQNSVAPISVIDQDGKDWTEVVGETDGNGFASELSGELLVVFPSIEGSSGISIDAVTKSPCPYEDPVDPPKAAIGNYAPSSMVIEQLTENGDWVVLSDIPSRENPVGTFVMNNPSLAGNAENITIRIRWEGKFSTDEIRQYIPSDEIPVVNTWQADNFRLNLNNQAAKVWQGFEPSGTLELRKDEFIEFAFNLDEPSDPNMVRDYIIRAVGRYNPDYSVFTHLMPNQFQLYTNYPNPFNPTTKIAYDIPKPAQVKLEIINILGRRVTTLVDESQQTGHYEIIWNGKDYNGNDVSSGIYFYRMTAGDFTSSKKMILQK